MEQSDGIPLQGNDDIVIIYFPVHGDGAEGGMIDYGAWVLAHLESKLAQYSGKVKSGISRGIHFFVKKGPHPWSPYFNHAFRGEMAFTRPL